MNQSLLYQRFLAEIQNGEENQYIEFKSAFEGEEDHKKKRTVKSIINDICKTLIAFANAEGGTLYIGVEDDGTITGVPYQDQDLKWLKIGFMERIANPKNFPIQQAKALSIDNQILLVYSIQPIQGKIFQLTDSRILKRINDKNEPWIYEEYEVEREEKVSMQFDQQICTNAKLEDLDWKLVEEIKNKCYPGNNSLSNEKFLQIEELAKNGLGNLNLTNAAVILFAQREAIKRLMVFSAIRFIQIDGEELEAGQNYNVKYQKEFFGNIFDLYDQALKYSEIIFSLGEYFTEQAKFENRMIFTKPLLQEILINALAHRCYATQTDNKIFCYQNNVEFRNAGKLLGQTAALVMYQRGFQRTRNILLTPVLRKAKFMRLLGEGTQRIKDESKKLKTAPVYTSNSFYFSLQFSTSRKNQEELLYKFEKIFNKLKGNNFEDAKKQLQLLIQSAFFGIAFSKLNQDEKQKIKQIKIEMSGYPSLYDEAKKMNAWIK